MGADEVARGLFVGDASSARCEKYLISTHITHILSVVVDWRYEDAPLSKGRTHQLLSLYDEEDEDLLTELPSAVRFVNSARKANGNVLIHCESGVSRSSAVAAACLMESDNLSSEQALDFVVEKRRAADPNPGFRLQLRLWYEMGRDLNGSFLAHLHYRQIRNARALSRQPDGLLTVLLPTVAHHLPYATRTYSCRACRFLLCTDRNVLHIDNGSAFVEPMQWMSNQLTRTQSSPKLHCPCGVKLGAYDISKVQPSVRITLSKVDVTSAAGTTESHTTTHL